MLFRSKRAYRYGKEKNHPSKMLQCSMRVNDGGPGHSASSWHIEKIAGGDFVYTCPPSYIEQLMKAEDRLPAFDAKAIDEDASPELIEKLRKIPYLDLFEYWMTHDDPWRQSRLSSDGLHPNSRGYQTILDKVATWQPIAQLGQNAIAIQRS